MISNAFKILAGLASLLGFGISIIVMYSALDNDLDTDMKEVIILLSVSLAILLFSVIFILYISFKESRELSYLPLENDLLDSKLKQQERLVFYSAEYFHNIAHYYRNLVCDMENLDPKNIEQLKSILINFDKFMTTLTSNLQSYFSRSTGSDCCVTIKITKYEDSNLSKVKTFYRDPISYRKRKKSDKESNGKPKIFDTKDNTAYAIIVDENTQNTSFSNDDLIQLRNDGLYSNRTHRWWDLYTACAVVAISKNDNNGIRRILGFLCVDNDSGRLANAIVENYLNGFADMMYILFEKYENIVKLAIEKEIINETIQVYTDWDNS